ncbi:glycoside hydrolase family 3 N-terminal domain-containing protein [Porphyromonas pogonae]|uniref:glycoside hydrolase family 3 N-terminal domain-containing protein n=1 Tax=Porphyromonas pogonae TaxID=867595 RepID=UPI002E799CB1|nr:glycoside hydrolase family 3 N-terminal domain-containing protein [Porphyromonas pogonae]
MNRWVNRTMQGMTLEEKVGQLIMPVVNPSDRPESIRLIRNKIAKEHWGGILFQKGYLETQKTMSDELQRTSNIPLLVSLDGEWGLNMRLKDAPRYPRNMALSNIVDNSLIYQYGREVARQCRIMDIFINFAPVLDVNNNPQNPVIGTRSFGSDPMIVSCKAIAYAKGLEDGGVLAVGKHFPGHGNTSEDSHKTLPSVSASRSSLEKTELLPFREYIRSGLGGIMVGHLRVPALEPEPIPSSLSYRITTDLLKNKMGFKGLVFTDGLEMRGVQSSSKNPISVRALAAGNDILLGPISPSKALQEVVDAVKTGVLSESLINAKCKKVLEYKYRLIMDAKSAEPTLPDDVKNQIYTPASIALCQKLWRNSLLVRKNTDNTIEKLREGKYKSIAVLNIGNQGSLFENMVSKYGTVTHMVLPANSAEVTKIEQKLSSYDMVIVNQYNTSTKAVPLISRLTKKTPVILNLFTSPYYWDRNSSSFSNSKAVLIAYEYCKESVDAVVYRLFGTDGKQSVKLPTMPNTLSKHIINPISLSAIDRLAKEGIQKGAYPGCQIVVISKDNIIYNKSFGTLTGSAGAPAVNNKTLYDLASVTKAIATTPAVMLLIAQHKISLNTKLGDHVYRFADTPLENITVKELLLHQAGLTPSINFYTDLIDSSSYSGALIRYKPFREGIKIGRNAWGNPSFDWDALWVSSKRSKEYPYTFAPGIFLKNGFKDKMLDRIAFTPLRGRGSYKYSDIGFLLLQHIVENSTDMSLDDFIQKNIYSPMGVHLYFNPLEKGIKKETIAPSHKDNFLRKRIVQGTVDDETAACMGGIAGNAGLFGSAEELAKILMLYMNNGIYEGKQIIPSKIFKQFISNTGVHGYRCLGFDKPRFTGASLAASDASQHHLTDTQALQEHVSG